MVFKALAEQDGGDFSLMERTLPPGGRRPPPHRHTNCSEAYFVLDGLVSVTVEQEELTVGPEGFVLVPRGTAHTFGNAAGHEARLLVIHAPAMDAYFAGLHELWNRDAALAQTRNGTHGPLRHGAARRRPNPLSLARGDAGWAMRSPLHKRQNRHIVLPAGPEGGGTVR